MELLFHSYGPLLCGVTWLKGHNTLPKLCATTRHHASEIGPCGVFIVVIPFRPGDWCGIFNLIVSFPPLSILTLNVKGGQTDFIHSLGHKKVLSRICFFFFFFFFFFFLFVCLFFVF